MRGRIVGIAIALVVVVLAVAVYALRRDDGAEGPSWKDEQKRYFALRHVKGTVEVKRVVPAWEASPRRPGGEEELCTSCHIGVADPSPPNVLDFPRELRPHTNKLSAKHGVERLGCTVCHGGQGGELTIAAHRGMHDTAAGCGTCHTSDDASPAFAKGRAIFRRERCGACHSVARSEPLRGTGPSLDGIAARTTPEHALRVLRSDAGAMPSFWPPPRDPVTRAPLAAGTPGHDAWLARQTSETSSIVAYLFDKDDGKLAEAVARRANVTGASAEDGKKLFDAIGCAACHGSTSLFDLREDWLAWFLEDPARAHPRTTMPSFRLDRREAASLAKHLAQRVSPRDLAADELATITEPARRRERVRCNLEAHVSAGQPPESEMTRAKCGELLYEAYGCGGCHGGKALELPLDGYALRVPDDKAWGQVSPDVSPRAWDAYTSLVLESPRIFAPASRRMPQHRLAPDEVAALRFYLAGLAGRTPTPEFDPTTDAARGAILEADLACGACHEERRERREQTAPSLRLEGARVRASWLTAYLRDPGARGVRPPLHPEWVWGSLVPLDKLAVRMPSYALEPAEVGRLVAALGATEPPSENRTLTRDARARALAMVALRPCLGCHYTGELPVDRAKTSLADLAPDLGATSSRLRAEWVRSFLGNATATATAQSPHTTGDPDLLVSLLFSLRPSP